MPVEAAERIGSLVDGRYKITAVLSAGSMGAVFKAERVPVGKLVAIKFLHASYVHDSEFQARFDRETRVMSKLNHPNCVSVLDFGVWQGEPYLVMDFVDGVTLRSMMGTGPLAPNHALQIARQVLSGLAHAHNQEIFHRDVKPANIMISEEIGHGQRVRILDFGLARLKGNVGRDATQTNMVVGTPNYMAPEQTVPGGSVDGRADLYAVGVVLFEMLTGERPFQAEDTLQLLGMHRAAPVPRLADRMKAGIEVPKGTQELIDRAMAKSPEQRFQSAIEFAEAIDEVLQGKLDPTVEDVTLPKSGPIPRGGLRGKKMNTGALASTVLDIDSSSLRHEESTLARSSRFPTALFVLLLVIGGGAALAGYLMKKGASAGSANARQTAHDATAAVGSASEMGSAWAPGSAAAMGSAEAMDRADSSSTAHAGGTADATTTAPGHAGAASDAGATDAAVVADVAATVTAQRLDDAGLPILGEPDPSDPELAQEEVHIDPEKVDDPDPEGDRVAAEDEDENAPKSADEVDRREPAPPPAPQLAKTIHGAVLLIKAGKKDLALASLRALHKKNPSSAYIPFLMGNVYFDRTWWSVAMDHYEMAIKKNAGYRRNPVLNRNVIRMLASTKTRQRATNFLRGIIGKFAAPHLRWAAKNDRNPVVRKQAAILSRYIR
jgi:serine/threonine-protein kinase